MFKMKKTPKEFYVQGVFKNQRQERGFLTL